MRSSDSVQENDGMTEKLTSRILSDHLHSTFRLHVPDSDPVPLELISVTERNLSPQVENFSVIFRGPRGQSFAQRIHTLEHEKLGTFDLFLVPIGPDDNGMCYEAIFNRMRSQNR
jgi:hypothetical protein